MDEKDTADTQQPNKPVFWSTDHRIIFANSFNLRTGNNDWSLELGTEQNVNGVDALFSPVQLMLTPTTAKLLASLLTLAVEQMEKILGPIKIDQNKLDAEFKNFAVAPSEKSIGR